MRLVIQRVSRAEVRVAGSPTGKIGRGFVVLVGLERGDREEQLDHAVHRLTTLRAFDDPDGKMNLGLDQVDGAVLAVSQFTLAGSTRRGRRPSFDHAMPAAEAEPLFATFVERLRAKGVEVQTGVFGALMEVELVNDGPVTLLWDDSAEVSSEQ